MLLRFIPVMLVLLFVPIAQAAPKVVVSLAPLHSLAVAVMQGVATPELLVEGKASPHSYMLKPSQARSLHQADLIVWVGENMEGFLPKTLASLDERVAVLELMDLPEMVLLESREGGMWEAHTDAGSHGHHHEHAAHMRMDGHLWLNPDNTRIFVRALVERLSQLDQLHAPQYQTNGRALLEKLELLDSVLAEQLSPIRTKPYLVFHDAYQYLEQHYGLNAVGSVMVDAERKPGARRLSEIRHKLQQAGVRCVFAEPQFSASVIRVITEGSDVEIASLDPMGSKHKAGPELYFALMRDLGDHLSDCLGAN